MKSKHLAVLLAAALSLAAGTSFAQTTAAKVTLGNCGDYVFTDAAATGGSVSTSACGAAGAAQAEGGAAFSSSPSVFLNLVSSPGRGVTGLAYLDDYVTFQIASGTSAVVAVNVAGNFRGTLFPSFEVDLGLGSHFFQYHGSTTDSIDGNPGSDVYFPQTGDPLTGVIGSHDINYDWTIVGSVAYEVLIGVKAGASDGASIYIDDPLTFRLPAGVTLSSLSGMTYAAVTAVPEPETYALLLAGLGFMAVVGRRKSRCAPAVRPGAVPSPRR